ncbi:hypothetical protein [Leucobacter musarum]|uniref:hypothetical protein n=1 Tax=Leucobacter musarum TaxID=1930747 RepID=UPI0006A7BB12|nr:hypothetical protein [Leucobacter musarum]
MTKLFLIAAGFIGATVVVLTAMVLIFGQIKTRSADLTAIGTLGAVFASLLFSIDSVLRERKRDASIERESQNERYRGQAEAIWWWLEECPVHKSPFLTLSIEEYVADFSLERTDRCWGINLVVENRSDHPINHIALVSSEYIKADLTLGFYETLGGSSKRTYHLSAAGCSLLYTPPYPGTSVHFADSKGMQWVREVNGKLKESGLNSSEVKTMAEEAESVQRTTASKAAGATYDQRLRDDINGAIEDGTFESRIEEFDHRTFLLLQDLQPGHPRRRKAELWWQWRSGKSRSLW